MMWEDQRLNQVANIFSGYAFSASDMQNAGIPIIKIANIQDKSVLQYTQTYLPKEKFQSKLEKYVLKDEDILVAMTGAGSVGKIGKMNRVKEVYLVNQRVGIIRVDTKKANPVYVFKALNLPHYEEYLYNIGIGAGQPNISPSDIGNLKIKLPPLPAQQKIADIFSAYDDLIENNNRRIEILEKSAQNLYKEWFVRFRFPNYKETKFDNGLPKGWEVNKLSEFVYVTDGTHDTPKQTDSGYFLVTGKCIVNDFVDFSKAYFISEEDHKKIKKRSGLVKGDILFSNIGTVGSVSIIDYDIDFSVKNVIILKYKTDLEKCYLYCLLKNSTTQELFNQQTNGSSQQFISLGFMRNFKLLIPKKEILEQFKEHIEPIIVEKFNLYKENRNLIKQRDLLLPRLMSGKLEI